MGNGRVESPAAEGSDSGNASLASPQSEGSRHTTCREPATAIDGQRQLQGHGIPSTRPAQVVHQATFIATFAQALVRCFPPEVLEHDLTKAETALPRLLDEFTVRLRNEGHGIETQSQLHLVCEYRL